MLNERINNEKAADRAAVSRMTFLRFLGIRIKAAGIAIKDFPLRAFYILAAIVLGLLYYIPITGLFPEYCRSLFKVFYIVFATVGLLGIILLIGTPRGSHRAKIGLLRAGVVNAVGEPPLMIDRWREGKITMRVFNSCGIPLHVWEDRKLEIESALNLRIGNIEEIGAVQNIKISSVPGKRCLPDIIPWSKKYATASNDSIALGVGYFDNVQWDINSVPHILVAGATGSGKTVLALSCIYQLLNKGATVYIADLKRGGDYPMAIRNKCTMCYTPESALEALTNVHDTMEARLKLLNKCGCANMDVYVEKYGGSADRIVFVVDEMAELLDKSGRTKEEKAIMEQIDGKLSSIARLGRAAKVSLLLSMQRPDANVLNGQIKNNVNYRVCGRADNVLSMLVLDNVTAEEQIPKNAKGMFINHEGTIFRGFWHDSWDVE